MRTRLMRGKFTLLFMVLGLLLAVPAIAFAQDATGSTSPVPTVQSDKADYAPGELVTLTGSGWVPGESVNIVVNDDVGQTWNRNVNVIADPSGNITDSFNLPEYFVASYSVTATAASGTATTSFTDAARLQGLRLGSLTGAQRIVFTAGNTIVPDPQTTGSGAQAGKFYKYTVLNPGGTAVNTTTCLSFAQLTDTTVESYTVQANDPLSTSSSWTYRMQEFNTNACSGTAASSDTIPFYVAKATAYSDSGLTTADSTFGANATAFVKVEGLNPSDNDWSTTWLLPNGNVACENTNGNDRPDSSAAGRLPSAANSFLQYPPNNTAIDAWNKQSSYNGACPAFATGNAGDWKLRLEGPGGQENSVDLPVFSVANDTTAPTSSATATVPDGDDAGTDPDPYSSGTWTNKDVEVTLSGQDEAGGSGFKEIRYTLDGTTPNASSTLYTGPFTRSSTTTVKFLAYDNAGNAGTVNTFQVNIDKVAPTITASRTPAANGAGWNKTDVTVSYTCNDTGGSGLAGTCPGNDTVSSEGENQTRSGTVTDQAGNSATATVNGINIDKTAPTITASRTPAANANGWNNTNVTVSYTCADSLSGVDSSGCPAADTVSTEGANQSVTSGNVTDKAGNTATKTVSDINIDKTAPTINASRTPAANANGWNNTNVAVSFTCNDGLSGVDGTCGPDQTLTSEGANQSVTGNVTDKAGNTATKTVSDINIDKTAPTINASRTPAANANGWNNTDVAVSFTCNDTGGSDVDSCEGNTTVSNETNGQNVTGTATDKAGNTATATVGPIKIDKTAPTINASRTPAANANGWNNSDVTVSFTCSDALSGLDGSCPADEVVSSEGANQSVTKSVTDKAGNTASATKGDINIDKTAPTITASQSPAANSFGWNNTNVTVSYNCADSLSGVASGACPASDTVTTDGANQSRSGSVTDKAGNTASATKGDINIDKTAPTDIAFVGGSGLSGGGSYDFNSVPAGPTGCTADGAISGLQPAPDGCKVEGYGTAVGPHTVTATAKDKAGNTSTKTLSYTVKAANAYGFYQPVDMGDTLNTVKSGSTVPVKFELIGGSSNIEQKSTNAVGSISASKVNCALFTGDPVDAIEYLAPTSENTGLRFDTTGDQFIYNWKTPAKAANTCYSLTMKAADQQTTLVAYFQLK